MSQASPLRNLPAVKAATSAASAAPAFDTKKALAIGGAALLAAIAAYFLLREKKSSAVSASTAAAVEEPSVTKPAKGKIEESVEEEEVEDESEEEEVVRVGAGGECTKEVLLQILGEMHRKIVDLQVRQRASRDTMVQTWLQTAVPVILTQSTLVLLAHALHMEIFSSRVCLCFSGVPSYFRHTGSSA